MMRVCLAYQPSSSLTAATEIYPASCDSSRSKQRCVGFTTVSAIPARDVVIDFGKFKGSKMGTLPSGYLRWLTREANQTSLAAWGEYATQVLQDPYYNDRLEWESIEKLAVLGGGDMRKDFLPGGNASVKGSMLALGWDLSDPHGWSQVNFSLLGTSLGGRIPRKNLGPSESNSKATIASRFASQKPTMKASHISSTNLTSSFNPTSASKKPKSKSSLASPAPHNQDPKVDEPGLSRSLRSQEELLRRRRLRKERSTLRSSSTLPSITVDVRTLFPGRDSYLERLKNGPDR